MEPKGRFYRGDTGNTPPAHLNDEVAIKAMEDLVKQGLNGLKAFIEQPFQGVK